MASALQILSGIKGGDFKFLARALTIVENDLELAQDILLSLEPDNNCPVIGITGPPGAGKSTLVNALLSKLTAVNKRVAVLAIDPTSPFNFGSLLGDRIRMADHFNNKNVFIRSVAARGSLGGLSVKAIEMVDLLKAAAFDFIIIETVGVGQSEVEIAGLADMTVVVLVPESGDEIQVIKSGLMEIATVFVVNKADREGADHFVNNLKNLTHGKSGEIPVLKTIAEQKTGVDELFTYIVNYNIKENERRIYLLAEKAYKLIQERRMQDIKKADIEKEIKEADRKTGFNLYQYVSGKIRNS